MDRSLVEYLDMLPMPAMVLSLEDMKFKYVNEASCSKYGYSKEEFTQLGPMEIRPAEDVEKAKQSIQNFKNKPYSDQGIWRHITKSGKLLYVKIMSQPVVCEGQSCILATVVDVTRQLELNQYTNNILASLFESTLCAITDADGVVQDISVPLCQKIGKTYSELVGQQFHRLLAKADRHWIKITAEIKKEGAYEDILPFKSGEQTLWCSTQIHALRNLNNDVDKYLLFAQDITPLMTHDHKQEQVISLLHRYADMASHKVREPLTAIQGLIELEISLNQNGDKTFRIINDKIKAIDKVIHEYNQIMEELT